MELSVGSMPVRVMVSSSPMGAQLTCWSVFALERAGMASLDQGQRLSFEVVRDERTCAENLSASGLKAGVKLHPAARDKLMAVPPSAPVVVAEGERVLPVIRMVRAHRPWSHPAKRRLDRAQQDGRPAVRLNPLSSRRDAPEDGQVVVG